MFLFLRRRPRAGAVARDVERMLRHYGAEAHRVAGEMSWREDAGLLSSPTDGHWHHVHVEIGRRIGQAAPVWTSERDPDIGPAPARYPTLRQTVAPAVETRLPAATPAE